MSRLPKWSFIALVNMWLSWCCSPWWRSRLHRYVSYGQSFCAHVLRVLCKVSVTLLCKSAHGWIFLGIRANLQPKPPLLPNTDYCVSCPWSVIVVVTERLYKALGRNRGSSVFLMVPEHHLATWRLIDDVYGLVGQRDVLFHLCATVIASCGHCLPLQRFVSECVLCLASPFGP